MKEERGRKKKHEERRKLERLKLLSQLAETRKEDREKERRKIERI